MKLNAFSCRDGYILSSDCMLAPMDAETAHGDVSALLGIVDCTDLPADVGEMVSESVYSKQYAFLPTDLARRIALRIERGLPA